MRTSWSVRECGFCSVIDFYGFHRRGVNDEGNENSTGAATKWISFSIFFKIVTQTSQTFESLRNQKKQQMKSFAISVSVCVCVILYPEQYV